MYAKIEAERLRFFQFNQDAVRADLYQGIVDAIGSKGYPKPFANETSTNDDGYPTYRRRPGSEFVRQRHTFRQHKCCGVGDNINEVDDSVDARYLSASECLWRIFGYPLHGHSPTSTDYQSTHPEDGQNIYFNPNDDPNEALEHIRDSPLMGWFSLNQRDPATRNYLYTDIPKHYTWDKTARTWRPRRRPSNTIEFRPA
jgi:hypothetical protein